MDKRADLRSDKFYAIQLDKEIKHIESYIKESGSGLTKEQYFEMCEMLGSDPIEEEIPVSREDLTYDTQSVFNIYDKLSSRWEGFSGQYLGKDLGNIDILFKLYKFERSSILYTLDIIPIIDNFVAEDIAGKIKSKQSGDTPSGN